MPDPNYPAAEALLLTQIRAATGFTAANATRGDWRWLNKEGIIAGAVIRPAPFELGYGEGMVEGRWRSIVEIWRKYVDDGTTLINLETDVKNIVARLILYQHMGDTTNTVTDAAVTSGAEVLRIPPPPVGPHWLMQELTIEWIEHAAVTYAE